MASLKFMLENVDDLEDPVKGLYSKHTDGNFYLDVDGAVAKGKVDEFRDNNISLKQQLEEVNKKFESVDLEKYNEMLNAEALDDGKKRVTLDKVDGIVEDRTKAMKGEYETQIGNLKTQIGNQGSQLNGLLIDGAVRDAAVEARVRKGALEDVVLRAQTTFKVIEGKAVAHDTDGKIVYGKNGTDPLTPSEWITGLKGTAEHLFEQSKGGGAGGGDNSGGGQQQLQQQVDQTTMSPLQKISQGMAAKE